MSNITEVTFTTDRYAVTEPLYQYDYGQVLKITAPSLPDPYTVHFGNARSCGESLTVIGTASDGAAIPSALLATGLNVYAWVFLHTGENDGETEYMIEIPVIRRAEPTDDPVIEEDPSAVDIIMGEIAGLKEDIEQLDGLSDDVKTALLQIAQKVAYVDDDGETYYQDLYDALYPPAQTYTVTNTLTGCTTSNSATSATENAPYSATITASSGYSLTGATVSITMGGTDITATAYNNGAISIANVTGDLSITITAVAVTLSSISAVYTQSGTVYDTDSLDSLKADLVVTATWSDSSTTTVDSADYTLNGTLTVGTSTITVSYGGKTTTFNVTVTEAMIDMTGSIDQWKDLSTQGSISNRTQNGATFTAPSTAQWNTYIFQSPLSLTTLELEGKKVKIEFDLAVTGDIGSGAGLNLGIASFNTTTPTAAANRTKYKGQSQKLDDHYSIEYDVTSENVNIASNQYLGVYAYWNAANKAKAIVSNWHVYHN